MRVLSVQQPWASLLVLGAKRFETRSWHTAHRGPLAIHAARRFSLFAQELCGREPFRTALRRGGFRDWSVLPRGALLGTVDLLRCVYVEELADLADEERTFGDFRPGRWAWELGSPLPLPVPLPARGRLGVFELAVALPTIPVTLARA